jgi:hypothetical protein
MSHQTKHEYTEIPVTDSEEISSDHKKTTFSLLVLVLVIIATSIVSSSITLLVTQTTSPPVKTNFKQSCGNSSGEAEALGCSFDPLTFSWLPKDCPRDLTEEFIEFSGSSPWQYWMDQEGTQPILSYDDISKVDWYWTKNSEHSAHCAFMLLRFHRVLARGETADILTMNYGHAHHCLMLLLTYAKSSQWYDYIGTHGDIGFGSC